jgi:hypothetical protein
MDLGCGAFLVVGAIKFCKSAQRSSGIYAARLRHARPFGEPVSDQRVAAALERLLPKAKLAPPGP